MKGSSSQAYYSWNTDKHLKEQTLGNVGLNPIKENPARK